MNTAIFKPVNDAPKVSSRYAQQEKKIVGVITEEHGGICWVRDTLRRDKIVKVIGKPISNYWIKTFNNLFSKW